MLPQRFTFISDPTAEFPNNTNQKFKVRLPVPLRLEGQWDASLWSLSVPDQQLQNKTLFQDTSQVILDFKFTLYKLSGYSNSLKKYQTLITVPKNETLTVKDVMNESTPAQTGVEFWQNCLRMMEETIMREALEVKTDDARIPVAIPQAWKPTFKWDGEDLVLEELALNTVRGVLPRSRDTVRLLHPYQDALRQLTQCKRSVKNRRELLMSQSGGAFWSELNRCFKRCCDG